MSNALQESDRTLILLRTHFVDDEIAGMARRLGASEDYDVMIAADESGGPLDAKGLPIMSMTLDSCFRLGLSVAFRKPLWRCGDYVFYHALALNRGYKRFWLIEYDVVINFDDPLEFFRFFDARASEDYLCACLREAHHDWYWRSFAAPRFAVVNHALFPLVRLSAAAAAQLLRRRQFETQRLREQDLEADNQWPNDEGFVSSAAPEMGITMADFNDYGAFYSEKTFAPHLLSHISEVPPPDNKVYHAVRKGRGYLKSRNSYYALDLMRALTCRDPEFVGVEFREFVADLIHERLLKVADDPAAAFRLTGKLGDVLPFFENPDVSDALLLALARARMRICLEVIQLHRCKLAVARGALFDNVALGRTAWQSSISPRSRGRDPRRDAEGGNDGKADSEYGFHTGYEDEPWWAVDLAAVYPVRAVRLHNRKLAEHRLSTFRIEASLDFVAWEVAYRHDPTNRRLLHARPIEIAFAPTVSARYIRVRLARRGVLHLAQVEVLTK